MNFSDKAINWFRSYLIGRQQAVLGKNRNTPKWNLIGSAVPQGSIFDSLLFLTYIDDIRWKIKFCKWLLYADDLQIYIQTSRENISEAIT